MSALPRWDMTPIFPSLDSPEFNAAFETLCGEIKAIGELFERHNVRRRAAGTVDAAFVAAYEEITNSLNALSEKRSILGSYIECFVTTDARDEEAKARAALLEARSILLSQLRLRYVAWVGSSDIEALIAQSAIARAHEFNVRKAQVQNQHQMDEAQEELAAELQSAGLSAWARLHGNVTALLTAPVVIGGEEKTLPMSSIRSLGANPDREVRRAAFEAELKAWEGASIPLAAALNSIKGFQGAIRRRRRYEDDVAPTLLANSIDRPTLDAMQAACLESFPDFRRYMDCKARALGLDRLAWYDLTAPLATPKEAWNWPNAEQFIRENFGHYSERLAAFADRSFRERWIDAEPRVGKEGGAYCTGMRPGESRVMMNFDGSFTGVSTLAHELGHAYHNLNLGSRTPLQRGTPSTLAETASIFCETLAFDAVLEAADAEEKLALLDTTLERDLMVVVDIHSRFLFEKSVFEARQERELTAPELNSLMTDAQRQTYGENLEPLHPYMWAVKGHYYGPTFYNYPYTFGLLFGLGLYARYREDRTAFRARYDDFLSSTGLADAATLASRFGIDVRQVDFWRESLDVIREKMAEAERLVGQRA